MDKFLSFPLEWTLENILKVTALGLAVLCLLMLAVSLILFAAHKNRRTKLSLKENTRIYIVDLATGRVKKFDRRDIRHIAETDLEQFYAQFDPASRPAVRNWLSDLVSRPRETRSFLETEIHISKADKRGFALLEMTSVNPERQIVHLNSHLLPHLSDVSSKHHGKHYLINFETMQAKYQQAVKTGKKRGVGCLIKIYSKHDILVNSTKFNMGATTVQITNLLTPYLRETRFLLPTAVNEVFIFDATIATRSMFFTLANELMRSIERYLIMNSLDDEFGVAIGAALFEPELADVRVFIARCREMSQLAEREENLEVALYEENSNKISNTASLLYGELASLVHNRSFRYYFTPILSSLDASVLCYDTKIIPYGSSLASLDEVMEAAQDVQLTAPLDEILMTDVLKSVKGDEKIIFRLGLNQLREIVDRVEDGREKPFLLTLDQSALSLFEDESVDFLSFLERARNLGYQLALAFNQVPESPLDEEILRIFDAFIIEETMTQGVNTNERIRADIRLMLASYSVYDKPIAVLGLRSINDLEVSLALGVKFFTCLAFANASSTLEVLDEKKKERLLELNRRLN